MVTTSSSVSNATLARAKAFSSNVQNSMLLNLVSEWTFDDSNYPTDDSWGVNDGTLNEVVPSTYQNSSSENCVFGGCYEFSGDDYIDCGNNSSLAFGTGNFTVSIWFKANTLSGVQSLIGTQINSGNYNGWMIANYLSNKLRFEGRDASGSKIAEFDFTETGKWHHFVGVRKGLILIAYIDGIIGNSSNGTVGDIPFLNKLLIGARPNLLSSFFNGSIDDVRIYDAALSSSQIKQNYIAGLNSLLAKGNISKEEYDQKIENLGSAF